METLCHYSWYIPDVSSVWNSELEDTLWPYTVGKDKDGKYFCDVHVEIEDGITSFALANGDTLEEAIRRCLDQARKMKAEGI